MRTNILRRHALRGGWGVALAGLLMVTLTAVPASATTSPPTMNGSFIQPQLVDELSNSQLGEEENDLVDAGLSQQVLQWTADSGAETTVFPSDLAGYTQSTDTDVVGRLLDAASDDGIDVYVGLQTNNDWWTNYANDTTWLDDQASIAEELADDLYTTYGSDSSFAGWYIPFEMDNWNFTTESQWSAMASFYTTVDDYLHELSPGLPVIIAPFFNTAGGETSSQWTSMWEYVLANAPIDVIALQDGVGDGHATTGQLATWYGATQTAIEDASPSTQLWADTDTYTDNGAYEPMSVGSVIADMTAEQPYVSDFLTFSYDHYYSPLQGGGLYNTTYLDYLSSGSVESSPPTTPTDLSATDVDALTVDLSWTASTDNVGVAGYEIFRDGELVATIYGSATSYTDTQLDSATSYTYNVAAFDAAGNVSSESSSASATTATAPDNPDNLALDASYTSTLAASPSYPDDGQLTDGEYGSIDYADPAWEGRLTSSPYSITVNLGSVQTINEVDSDWLQYQSVAIYLPAEIQVSVSTDGTDFTAVGTMDAPAVDSANQAHNYRLLYLSVSAQYVRITVTPANSAWTFTDELQVRAS